MDVMQMAAQSRPGELPSVVYITINGTAAEIQAVMGAMEKSLYDGPQALEVTSANGVKLRIVVDRLDGALVRQ